MEMPEGWKRLIKLKCEEDGEATVINDDAKNVCDILAETCNLMKEMAEALEYYEVERELDCGLKASALLKKFKEWK